MDRWSYVEGAGVGLLGGGVWALGGAAWACITWGVLLLAAATVRALVLASAGRRAGGRSE